MIHFHQICHFVPHHILNDLALLNGENLPAPDVLSHLHRGNQGDKSFDLSEPRKVTITVTPLANEQRRDTADPHRAGDKSQADKGFSLAAAPQFPVYDLNGATEYNDPPEYQVTQKDETTRIPGDSKDWPQHAKNALENAQKVYQFYKENFGRESIDNKGMDVISCVRLRTFALTVNQQTGESTPALDQRGLPVRIPENNAFWDDKMMCYGEGDNMVFTDFTASPDVIGHELTHGVTHFTCNLRYEAQSGALNESISDVFGVSYRQWLEGQKDPKTANWFIGDKVISEDFKKMVKVRGFGHWDALRSMADPGSAYNVVKDQNAGKDNQPKHMSNYWNGAGDSQGVHRNSGIPNHAFYLFVMNVGGPSWEIPAKVWYGTITGANFGKVQENEKGEQERVATFAEFANATIEVAKTIAPGNVQGLQDAWKQVGVI